MKKVKVGDTVCKTIEELESAIRKDGEAEYRIVLSYFNVVGVLTTATTRYRPEDESLSCVADYFLHKNEIIKLYSKAFMTVPHVFENDLYLKNYFTVVYDEE